MLAFLSQFAGILRRLRAEGLGVLSERFDRSPIATPAQLSRFARTRAAYVAQVSLYNYLKARMGTQFPRYFQDERFSRAIRAASLKLFAAALRDVVIFAVAHVAREGGGERAESMALADWCHRRALEEGFAEAGDEAPPAEAYARMEERVARVLWANVAQGDGAFADTLPALLESAPLAQAFLEQDVGLVSRALRFRWADVRAQFRRRADAEAVLAAWRDGKR